MKMPKVHDHARGGKYANITINGHRRSVYGQTEEIVLEKCRQLFYENGMGIDISDNDNLEDYLESWLTLRKNELKPYTFSGYRTNIEKHIIPYIGKIKPRNLLPQDIVGMYNTIRGERQIIGKERAKLLDAKIAKKAAKTKEEKAAAEELLAAVDMKWAKMEPLGETSLLYVHRVLSAALGDAVKNKKIVSNPAELVKAPRRKKIIRKNKPNEEKIRQLFRFARGKECELGVHLAVAGGLRRGEICAVKWSDMDFDTGILTVNKGMCQTTETGLIEQTVKDEDERELFIPDGLISLMRVIRMRQLADADVMGDAYVQSERMVRHSDGRPFTPYAMTTTIKRIIDKAELGITLHGLRRTYVSLGYKGGADEKAVSESVGHSTVAFNRERYQEVYQEMKEELGEIINEYLYPTEKSDLPAGYEQVHFDINE